MSSPCSNWIALALALDWPPARPFDLEPHGSGLEPAVNLTQRLTHVVLPDPSCAESGLIREADARTRTGDPFITSEVLYQLSYVGNASTVAASQADEGLSDGPKRPVGSFWVGSRSGTTALCQGVVASSAVVLSPKG
jgi:hypothetical protein